RRAPCRRAGAVGRRARAVTGDRHPVGRHQHGRRGMSTPKLGDALASARVLFDRPVLEQAIVRMAGEIRAAYAEGDVPLYITVMNGGLPFAAQLAFALGERGLDLEFDYLHATRYRGQTSGSGLAWLHRPATPMH